MTNSESNKFLIDGFPRNQDNLDGWNREMSEKANVQFCLYIDCSEDVSFYDFNSFNKMTFFNHFFCEHLRFLHY